MSRQVFKSSLKTSTNSPLSSPSATSSRVRSPRNRAQGLRSIVSRLLGLRYLVRDAWYIWASSVRSFRGHIALQSPRESDPGVGPLFVRGAEGEPFRRSTRTLARMVYIEMLLATYPWVDNSDLRIFLMGFDAGEEWSGDTLDNRCRTANSQAEGSWLDLASRTFGYVPDRVHQAISADSDQTPVAAPTAITK